MNFEFYINQRKQAKPSDEWYNKYDLVNILFYAGNLIMITKFKKRCNYKNFL